MQPLLLACLFALLAATQGQGEVDPSRIVTDVNKDCPVNTTLYTQDEFSVDKLFGLMTPMVSQGSRDSPCARAVPNLTNCAADGTLQVREGCCSTACAGKMQQALVSSGRQCYREFIEVMCNSTEIRESISRVLFGAAKRCLGLQPSCELLSQPGDLLNASTATAGASNSSNTTAGNSSNTTAATPPPQQQPQQQQVGNSTGAAEGNSTGAVAGNSTGAAEGNSSSGSGTSTGSSNSRGSGSAIVGNSFGMNELAAALAAQEAAPYAAPDPFMPLVPRPVETASSAVVLATPEEIDEAAARRNGSRRAIVTSNTTGPTTMKSSKAAGAANSTEPRAPPGAQGLAPPAAAAAAIDQDRAAPTPAATAARAATSSSTTRLPGYWRAGAAAAVMLLLTAVLS